MPRAAGSRGQTLDQTPGYLLAGPANKYWLAWINVLLPLLQLMTCLVLQGFVMVLDTSDLTFNYIVARACART